MSSSSIPVEKPTSMIVPHWRTPSRIWTHESTLTSASHRVLTQISQLMQVDDLYSMLSPVGKIMEKSCLPDQYFTPAFVIAGVGRSSRQLMYASRRVVWSSVKRRSLNVNRNI